MSDLTEIKVLPRMQFAFDPKAPRCVVKVSATTVDMGRGRNRKLKAACASFAKVVLNGTPMCLRHAQQEALRILMLQNNVR